MWEAKQLDAMPVHFIFCTERTGSSLLTAMLNMHPALLVASEEPFALYFQAKYQAKTTWTTKEISTFTKAFCFMFEKQFRLYYDGEKTLYDSMHHLATELSYDRLIKLCYINFYDSKVKPKDTVRVLIDKQMKYVYQASFIKQRFPNAKILILTRDVLPNVKAKKRRRIDFLHHPYYLAHLWKNTYERCLTFPHSMLVSFEDLIAQPDTVLASINAYFEVAYADQQLEYTQGFNALISQRQEGLSRPYIEELKDFHRGILQQPIQGKEVFLSHHQEAMILKKTELVRKALGYAVQEPSITPSVLDSIAWRWYGVLAYVGRTWLWTTYARIPLSIKRLLRKRKDLA